MPTGRTPERDVLSLFVRALRRLGEAGDPDGASRLAAQAWWGLKDDDPRAAEHVNGVMHYLARLPQTLPQTRPAGGSAPGEERDSEPGAGSGAS